MKKKTTFVLLCVCFCLCISDAMWIQGKAEDAFIVEEEVIIGGETSPGGKEQSIPSVLPSGGANPEPPVSDVGVEKPVRPKKSIKQETVMEEKEEQETPISINSVPPVFRVPVRRQQELKAEVKEEQEVEEQEVAEVSVVTSPEQAPKEKTENPWWMLVIAGVFCLGGCISVFLQRKNRKNCN